MIVIITMMAIMAVVVIVTTVMMIHGHVQRSNSGHEDGVGSDDQ